MRVMLGEDVAHEVVRMATEATGHSDEHGHEAHYEDTQDLRIAAIFIILFGSLLGSLAPLLSRRVRTPSTIVNGVLRAFAGGVILGLAVVHIVPHSVSEFETIGEYPYSGVLILVGVLIMVLTENGLHALYHHDTSHLDGHSDGHGHVHAPTLAVGHAKDGEGSPPSADHHAHGPSKVTKVTAWMMEIGCVFHSVIIGIELGVSEEKYSKVVALIVALLFHQLIEGISLGSVISIAGFSFPKALLMVVFYSLTTPLGVAAGIGVAESFDPHSRTAIIVQGSLDGLAGGLLLYIGLVHLVCPDFCSGVRMTWKHRVATFSALLAGAAVMCTLAVWA